MLGFQQSSTDNVRNAAAFVFTLANLALVVALPDVARATTLRFAEADAGGPQAALKGGLAGRSVEIPAATSECSATGASCPRLPKEIAPSSPNPSKAKRSPGRERAAPAAQTVTNEAGDSLRVWTARPGTLWTTEAAWVSDCSLTLPYVGSGYMPCGYVTFYDAGWETSEKAPDTDVIEDAVYDSCETLVTSDKAEGWHVVGTEYIRPGWEGSHHTEIPISEPAECLGTWRLIYTYTQTFSDEETLSDSVEVTFGVGPGPLLESDRWGGGNPSETSCFQQCSGDPMNTATGEYSNSTTDLAIPGRGPGLKMTRTYSSSAARAEVSSALGRGWAFSYDMSLSVDSETGDATVINDNGSRTRFYSTSEGFAAPPRVLATLVENEDGTYTYTVKARTIYTFDASGKLTAIADLNGNGTTLAYDEAGQLHTATDGAGRTFTFSYDEAGRIEGIEDSTGRSVGYGYDEAGYLAEVTDIRGAHERFTYDEEGLLLTREDARGNVVLTNTYDETGRIVTQTDGLEDETTYGYTEGERTTTTEVTDPRGYVTKYMYENGILEKKIEAYGTSYHVTWSYEYDPATLGVSAVTDPNGHMTRMTYDANGNRTSTEDALGNRTESIYDSLDDLLEHTDANGVTTTYEYDENGNLLEASTPLVGSEPAESSTVEYAYESEAHPGDVTAITDPNGHAAHFSYDTAGNLESQIDAAGDETTYAYDERGDRLSEVSPRGNAEGAEPAEYTATFTYDTAGDRLTAADPLGNEREWSYDADGNVETETDANGHTTTYSYDAANQRVAAERPNGQIESTAYDKDGDVESQTDGLEHTTSYAYDPLGHLKEMTDPLGRKIVYVYDEAGNLASSEDPLGRTTAYAHDAANELTGIAYDEEPAKDVSYGYDAAGHRTSMSDATGESSYEYDSLGWLVATTDGNGDTTEYGYDLAGNETSITYPNGKTVAREFDSAERLESVSDWLGNTTSFAYNPDSGLTGTTFPEGTGNVDEYGYDRADRMSEVQMKQGTETLASLAYSRDEAGQIESLTSEGLPGAEEEAFEYDENGRLTKAGSESFGYDAANDLIEAPGTANTYDAANQLDTGTEVAYAYNALGQRTRESRPPASYLSSFGSFGGGTGQFSHPAGIAVDSEGDLWVVDEWNRRVEKFNREGEYLSSFGSYGTGNGQFSRPTDVAIDSKGNLWVTDCGNDRIEEFSASGKYLSQFGSEGTGNGQFKEPEGIAIDASGNIWVADTDNGRVEEFSSKGKFIQVIGEKGTKEGQIQEASDVAIGAEGHVWIADWANHVDEFSAEGTFIRWFGGKGSANGQFIHAPTVDVDGEGHVWVGDEGNDRVQEFNESGEYLGKFGTGGSGEGQFSFGWPMGLAVDSEGEIWVSDIKNNRVERWEVAEDPSPTSYKYDQAGDLTAVERPEAGETPAIEESYTYDGAGLRASQTVSGTTSYLTWDLSGGLQLLLNDGQTSYIYGPNNLPVEQISSEGTPTFYHHDQLGSTRMLTSASGEGTATFSYGAYGTPNGHTGTQTTPLGYAGQYTNAGSRLQYLRARVYDPVMGQFLTRDPLERVTRTPYSYGGGNPISAMDPRGLGACILGFIDCDESDDPCDSVASGPMLGLCVLPPNAQKDVTNAAAGYGDQASFGLTKLIRSTMGTNSAVNECSIWYHGGQAAAFLTQLGVAASPALTSMADYWSLRFAEKYPGIANYLALHAEDMYKLSAPAKFYLEWIAKHLPH